MRNISGTESLRIRNSVFKSFIKHFKKVYSFQNSTFKDALYGKNPLNGGYIYELISLASQWLEFFTVDIPADDTEIYLTYNMVIITPQPESIENFTNLSKENYYSDDTKSLQIAIAPVVRNFKFNSIHFRLENSIFAPNLKSQERKLIAQIEQFLKLRESDSVSYPLRVIKHAHIIDWSGKVIQI